MIGIIGQSDELRPIIGCGFVISLKRYLRRTPPRSEALRHSGGDNLLWTSATVTLYFDVELSSESLPGTEQKISAGVVGIRTPSFPL